MIAKLKKIKSLLPVLAQNIMTEERLHNLGIQRVGTPRSHPLPDIHRMTEAQKEMQIKKIKEEEEALRDLIHRDYDDELDDDDDGGGVPLPPEPEDDDEAPFNMP